MQAAGKGFESPNLHCERHPEATASKVVSRSFLDRNSFGEKTLSKRDQVLEAVAKYADVSKDLLADNTDFMDELAMDSLHVFELILELEKMYGFESGGL